MTQTKAYLDLLEDAYKGQKEGSHSEDEEYSKLEFLSTYVFDFTTYDSGMDESFAQKMLDVIECIFNRKTFEYHQPSNENYLNYLTMVNMPFLKDKLEWGTSIRGAWFNLDNDCNLFVCDITIPKGMDEIRRFMGELIEWANKPSESQAK